MIDQIRMNMNIIKVKFEGFPPIKSKLTFRMKRENFLSVAIRSFMTREFLLKKSEVVFVFKNHKIKPGDTPASLKMKDNDTVEVHDFQAYQAYAKKFNSQHSLSSARKGFIKDMTDIMGNAAASDLTIKCGDKTFQVHSLFMTSRSSVFKAMMDTEMVEAASREILITDIDCPTLQEMIHFIYTGALTDKQLDLQNLWYAADKYDVHGLVEALCSKMKNEDIGGEKVADLLIIREAFISEHCKC